MLLLSVVLSYYLSSLYKHLFYFQPRVEQSVPFHHHFITFHLSVLTMVLDTKQAVLDYPAIRESMPPDGYPENTRSACTQAQAGLTHHPPVLGV